MYLWYIWNDGYYAHICILSTHMVLGSLVLGQLMNGDLLLLCTCALPEMPAPSPMPVYLLNFSTSLNLTVPCSVRPPFIHPHSHGRVKSACLNSLKSH